MWSKKMSIQYIEIEL